MIDCPHDDWTAHVTLYRDTDNPSKPWEIEVTMQCASCGRPMTWLDRSGNRVFDAACFPAAGDWLRR